VKSGVGKNYKKKPVMYSFYLIFFIQQIPLSLFVIPKVLNERIEKITMTSSLGQCRVGRSKKRPSN
jgi:hypothetical protein